MKPDTTAITSDAAAEQLEKIFAVSITEGTPQAIRPEDGKLLSQLEVRNRYKKTCTMIFLRRVVAFFYPVYLLFLAIPRLCDWFHRVWKIRGRYELPEVLKILLGHGDSIRVRESWLSQKVFLLSVWCDKSQIEKLYNSAKRSREIADKTIGHYSAAAKVIIPKLVELGAPVTGNSLYNTIDLVLLEMANKILIAKDLHAKTQKFLKETEKPFLDVMNSVITFCTICDIELPQDLEGANGKLKAGASGILNHYFKQVRAYS